MISKPTRTIGLLSECGEFCTERSHPALLGLREMIRHAVAADEIVIFDRAGIKILTPSFIDELLPALCLELGLDKVQSHVRFQPPLESILEQQIQRGMRLRAPRS